MVLEFVGVEFLSAVSDMHLTLANAQLCNFGPDTPELVESTRKTALTTLSAVVRACEGAQLVISADVARNMVSSLEDETVSTRWSAGMIEASIWSIRAAILSELGGLRFARVPRHKQGYFDHDSLFGGHVSEAFPLAAQDIRDSGNCLALGLDTAAVFHLMRVAEFGLRRIARNLGVSTIGKNKRPIDFENWNTICRAIDTKIDALNQRKPSARRAKNLRHYSEMNAHIRAFKDCWRNDVSHTRRSYDEYQASSVCVHVKGFMQRVTLGPESD